MHHVTTATLEHPGYLRLTITDGARVDIGADGYDFFEPECADGEPPLHSDCYRGQRTIGIGHVMATDSAQTGGNVYLDLLELSTGVAILVGEDHAFVYADIAAARAAFNGEDGDEAIACIPLYAD